MDKETVIFLGIFLSIAACLLSLAFPKKARIKVLKAIGSFIALMASAGLALWILFLVIPENYSALRRIIGFFLYSGSLVFFGTYMISLADAPDESDREQTDDGNSVKPSGDERTP